MKVRRHGQAAAIGCCRLCLVNQTTDEPPPAPSKRSLRGLDWFVFCVADVQTGFGPFVAVYLTTEKWTQVDIGLVLSVAGLVALVGQVPGGTLVDIARSERLVAGLAIGAISASALIYAAWPIFPAVLAAAVVHAGASCVLGPAMAAISLGLVGHAAIGERFGRNARFASIGNGLAAAAMGACGYYFSARAVFIVTAILFVPALLALRMISSREINVERSHGGVPKPAARNTISFRHLLRQRPLLILGCCLAAVPSRQRRHAAADGKRVDDTLQRVGDGPDRRLYRRAAAHCRGNRSMGGTTIPCLGSPSFVAAGIFRVADPRLAVCNGERALSAGCGATPGWIDRGRAWRAGAANGRRPHPRQRPVQLRARHHRNDDRHRRVGQPDVGRLPHRSRRQPRGVLGLTAIAVAAFIAVLVLMRETRPQHESQR